MELIKLHPPFTHFAIAMPVALLIIDLYYRIRKKDPDVLGDQSLKILTPNNGDLLLELFHIQTHKQKL